MSDKLTRDDLIALGLVMSDEQRTEWMAALCRGLGLALEPEGLARDEPVAVALAVCKRVGRSENLPESP